MKIKLQRKMVRLQAKCKRFRAQYGDSLIKHLKVSEKENVNLDEDDNLRTVYLTLKEILYLIDCIKKSGGKNG